MSPENPAIYKLDSDDRLQIPKAALPSWLQRPTEDGELFCVPIRWRRDAPLLARHELEAWCVWGPAAIGEWSINPGKLLQTTTWTAEQYALRTLIYPAKYDSKGRLSCAGIFNAIVTKNASRHFWVAPEADSVSVWTDAAFQWSYSQLGL